MFSYFSQETGFDISCKLPPLETICMKYQILFSGKDKKNIVSLSSAELAQRVVMVKFFFFFFSCIFPLHVEDVKIDIF